LAQVRKEALETRGAAVTLPSRAEIDAAVRLGPVMVDRGIWEPTEHYAAGDVVTFGNALWIARVASKGMKPGDGAGWRLANKSDLGHLRRAVRDEVAKQLRETKSR
jgi:hypothetical protein